MRILRWTFAGLVALLLGSGFTFLSGSWILGAVPAGSVLLVTAYLSWEAGRADLSTRDEESSHENSGLTVYGTAYMNTTDGGSSFGGDCGSGGDGGGC